MYVPSKCVSLSSHLALLSFRFPTPGSRSYFFFCVGSGAYSLLDADEEDFMETLLMES